MKRIWFKIFDTILRAMAVSLVVFMMAGQAEAYGDAQGQSGVVVTVTYSEPVNVRGGPSTFFYPIVGQALPGDVLPALGVSEKHEWVQVAFPGAPGGVGWLYAEFVTVSGGELRVVEPPPTPTPAITATINPTFAAAFIFKPTATKMPTFTPAPPLEIPQFKDEVADRPSGIAMGWLVFALLLIGGIGYSVTFLLYRR